MVAHGVNVQPITYPSVEHSKARLRFFISSTHTHEQLLQTAELLETELVALDASWASKAPPSIVPPSQRALPIAESSVPALAASSDTL